MRNAAVPALAVVFLFGCAHLSSGIFKDTRQKRLDALTSYTLALSKRDYRLAASLLSPGDRAKLADPETGILPEFRDRLRAMRLTTMMNNPLIDVGGGLITGIPDLLPVLAQGEKMQIDSAESQPETAFALQKGPEDSAHQEAEALRRTSASFFRAVQKRNWTGAMALVDAQERQDFVKADGRIKDAARRRLEAIDTSSWGALTLKDGKLTGIVLIIPSRNMD